MKWKEMTLLRKLALILCVLCAITALSLTILDTMGILASIDILEDLIDCIFWLASGVAFWKKKSLFPIVCFVMAGLNLICLFL